MILFTIVFTESHCFYYIFIFYKIIFHQNKVRASMLQIALQEIGQHKKEQFYDKSKKAPSVDLVLKDRVLWPMF
jgi:hypothetical protein